MANRGGEERMTAVYCALAVPIFLIIGVGFYMQDLGIVGLGCLAGIILLWGGWAGYIMRGHD